MKKRVRNLTCPDIMRHWLNGFKKVSKKDGAITLVRRDTARIVIDGIDIVFHFSCPGTYDPVKKSNTVCSTPPAEHFLYAEYNTVYSYCAPCAKRSKMFQYMLRVESVGDIIVATVHAS